MNNKISRRSFIKGGLAAAGAIAASSLPLPATVRGASQEELATLIDIRKCIEKKGSILFPTFSSFKINARSVNKHVFCCYFIN